MKATITIIAAMTMLAACASAPELLAEGPKVSRFSEKSVEAMRDCLTLNNPTTTAQPYEGGWMIKGSLPGSYYQPAWFAIVKAEAQGARVDIYYPAAYPGWRRTVDRCV